MELRTSSSLDDLPPNTLFPQHAACSVPVISPEFNTVICILGKEKKPDLMQYFTKKA